MHALAIHTSSPELGLALMSEGEISRHQVWPFARDLASHLQLCLMEFLQGQPWADLTFLAVAVGPGGFTGTRIGVVAARTLAQQLNIPLFGISSLAAVAESQRQELAADIPVHLAVEMQAQRGELFGSIYELTQAGLVAHECDGIFTPTAWAETLAAWPYPYRPVTATGGLAHTAPQVLTLAHRDWLAGKASTWAEVLPFYGQHPVE
ncbi:MAG TPA: tRNA (adenosine(37)-N6)-threonylcarbamoyltransferase complex dimerization subunit type 1 TsaB [Trichocoleus sp.]